MIKSKFSQLYYWLNSRKTKYFHHLINVQNDDLDIIEERQVENLNKLLNHAYNNVPYYQNIFQENELIENSRFRIRNLDDLKNIPILTKDIIRREGTNMYWPIKNTRKTFFNSSGGSTGKPIVVLQDQVFSYWSKSTFKQILDWRDVKNHNHNVILWGAQRDLYGAKNSLKGHLLDFIQNSKTINTGKMTFDDMKKIINYLNSGPSKHIHAYVRSIFDLALFAERNGIYLKPQKSIHTGAGMLYDHMREKIESSFKCKVFNHYGTREVSSIASECTEHNGLHILSDFNHVELVDDNEQPITKPGIEGNIIVTNLRNWSMPMIRYEIGDRASFMEHSKCSCGVNYIKLNKIHGRTSDSFINNRNEIISGEYLTLLFNYNTGVNQFQIIQWELNKIEIFLVINESFDRIDMKKVEAKLHNLFSEDLELKFTFVEEIKASRSGKQIFTICKIDKRVNN